MTPKSMVVCAALLASLATAETIWAQSAAPPSPPMHPLNGALRLGLELGALTAMGFWGYQQAKGVPRYALMAGIPLAAAAAWGVFAVPDDPSRGGTPVIAVPGAVRLALELAVFSFATFAIADMDQKYLAAGYGSAAVAHYAISYDRVAWLLGL